LVCNNPVFFQLVTKIKIHSSLFFSKISNEKITVPLMGREVWYIFLGHGNVLIGKFLLMLQRSLLQLESLGSTIIMATSYRLDGPGFES